MRIKYIQKLIDKIRLPLKSLNNFQNELFELKKQIHEIKYIFLPALAVHQKVFPKYKNINKDKSVVIMGSGPTLKYYNVLENAVHIGVNHIFTLKNFSLDYLFIHDNLSVNNTDIQKKANNYKPNSCKKFYGYHYINKYSIPEQDVTDANAERYYFIDNNIPTSEHALLSADISTRPLNCWSSVIFPAIEFALWTHPKTIYIVGCDCSQNGHIFWNQKENFCPGVERMLYGWQQIKNFRDAKYPDIEIISINPVGLKGLFKDIYTQ